MLFGTSSYILKRAGLIKTEKILVFSMAEK